MLVESISVDVSAIPRQPQLRHGGQPPVRQQVPGAADPGPGGDQHQEHRPVQDGDHVRHRLHEQQGGQQQYDVLWSYIIVNIILYNTPGPGDDTNKANTTAVGNHIIS